MDTIPYRMHPDSLDDVPLQTEMGEARMDIINSEMAYLGFHDSESYGLTWKVR